MVGCEICREGKILTSSRARIGFAVIACCGLVAGVVWAQEMPPAAVRFAEARRQVVRTEVVLPGTIRARTSSLVASEVAGLVVELRARQGDTVRRGQPLAKLRRQNLELRLAESKADLQESAARLDLARRSFDRSLQLYESGVISRALLDDAVSESDAWAGRVAKAEAGIARLEDDLDRSTIAAPFNGVIVEERVGVGEWLEVGGAVVEMVGLEDLEVVAALPERYFPYVKPGMGVHVSFESVPDLVVEGEVSAVVPQADPQARTFPVKVKIPDLDGQIGVGMLTRLVFAAGEAREALIVPKDAVINRGGRRFVYVIGAGETVEMVAVTLGPATGLWAAVEGEIVAGARVVVRGNERLRPGQSVTAELLEYELP